LIISLAEEDTVAVNQYIEKYKSLQKGASPASIASTLAGIYSGAGNLEKAEEYYRQALSLEPNNLSSISLQELNLKDVYKD
jgi:Tfp pilus assembly protein PilF